MFSAVVNFLCVNNKKYFVIVCFSKIATIIIASRNLVEVGKKICLFVYYVKFIGAKLWMARKGATLKGGLEHWMVEGRIKKGAFKAMQASFFFYIINLKK